MQQAHDEIQTAGATKPQYLAFHGRASRLLLFFSTNRALVQKKGRAWSFWDGGTSVHWVEFKVGRSSVPQNLLFVEEKPG